MSHRGPLRALQLAGAVGLSTASCTRSSPEPTPQGSLTVLLDTDLSVPKDLDAVELRVQDETSTISRQRLVLGPLGERLPLPLVLDRLGPPGALRRVRAVGHRGQAPVVLAERQVRVPSDGTKKVRLYLSYLCMGPASLGTPDANGEVQSACPKDQTCRGGRCVAQPIEEGTFDTPSERPTRERATMGTAPCFDGASCFQGASLRAPMWVEDRCMLPNEGPAPSIPALAMVPSTPGVGVCNETGPCIVPLEQEDSDEGFRAKGVSLELPAGACSDRVAGILVSPHCSPKRGATPLCDRSPSESSPSFGSPQIPSPLPSAPGSSSSPGPAAPGGPGEPPWDGGPMGPFVRGSILGLDEDGLVLVLDDGTERVIPRGARRFYFENPKPAGTSFAVSVKTQPKGRTCMVMGSAGSMEDRGPSVEPTVACGDLGGIRELLGGPRQICVLLMQGTLRCWGETSGSEGFPDSDIDTSIAGLNQVTTGASLVGHMCALLANGTVRCWGSDSNGQTAGSNPATPIPNLPSVRGLAVGGNHTCALVDDGTVRCWGDSSEGQTGGGTLTTPVPGLSGVVQISARYATTCALLRDGTVQCWGRDLRRVADTRKRPTVMEGLTGLVAITSGTWHSCGLLRDGTVKCWGPETFNELGKSDETHVIPGLSGVVEVTGAAYLTCVRLREGTARCFGTNDYELRQGSDTTRDIPGLTGVAQLRAVHEHVCALLLDGTLRCWGQFAGGIRLPVFRSPTPLVGLTGLSDVAAGVDSICAILPEGRVRCMGSNASGQTAGSTWASSIPGLSGAERLGMLGSTSCVLLREGTVRCWGRRGANNETGDSFPAGPSIPGLENVVSIHLGDRKGLALSAKGTVHNWGLSLDDPNPTLAPADPRLAIPGVTGATSLTAGPDFACAVLADTSVRCWGSGSPSTLGWGSKTESLPGLSGVVQVVAGSRFVCARLREGFVRCWGDNSSGQGAGSSLTQNIAGLSGVMELAAGLAHVCARMADGTVRCWGSRGRGQTAGSTPFEAVRGISGVLRVAAGGHHSCALSNEGTARCWGEDAYGEISGASTDYVATYRLAR